MTPLVNVSSALCCAVGRSGGRRPGRSGRVLCTPGVRGSPGRGQCCELCLGPVHACHADRPLPAPGAPCAAPGAFPFRLFEDSTAQDCRGHHMDSSPPAAAPRRDTASYQGSIFRKHRDMYCCGASLGAAPPQRGWLTCASVPTPLEQWPSVSRWPRQGRRLLVATAARTRAVPPPPHRPCLCSHEPCTLCRRPAAYISAACHSLPGTQGGQHTALCVRRRAATPRSPFFAQHRAAPNWHF